MSLFIKHHSYDGRRYEFVVTGDQIARCPKWDAEKEANPPLSAAAALAKAREFISTIKTKDDLEWGFEGLVLVNLDGWIWQARYGLVRKQGIMTGVWPKMDCWILMDGTVVQPRIRVMEDTK